MFSGTSPAREDNINETDSTSSEGVDETADEMPVGYGTESVYRVIEWMRKPDHNSCEPLFVGMLFSVLPVFGTPRAQVAHYIILALVLALQIMCFVFSGEEIQEAFFSDMELPPELWYGLLLLPAGTVVAALKLALARRLLMAPEVLELFDALTLNGALGPTVYSPPSLPRTRTNVADNMMIGGDELDFDSSSGWRDLPNKLTGFRKFQHALFKVYCVCVIVILVLLVCALEITGLPSVVLFRLESTAAARWFSSYVLLASYGICVNGVANTSVLVAANFVKCRVRCMISLIEHTTNRCVQDGESLPDQFFTMVLDAYFTLDRRLTALFAITVDIMILHVAFVAATSYYFILVWLQIHHPRVHPGLSMISVLSFSGSMMTLCFMLYPIVNASDRCHGLDPNKPSILRSVVHCGTLKMTTEERLQFMSLVSIMRASPIGARFPFIGVVTMQGVMDFAKLVMIAGPAAITYSLTEASD